MHNDKLFTTILIYCMSLLLAVFICTLIVRKEAAAQADPVYAANEDSVGEPTQAILHTPTVQPTPTTSVQNQTNLTPTSSITSPITEDAWSRLQAELSDEMKELLGERCIVLKKPRALNPEQGLSVSITDLPVERSVGIRIEGCEYMELTDKNFERIVEEEYFCGTPPALEDESESDPLRKLSVDYYKQENGSFIIAAELQLDRSYYYYLYESDDYYYISLVKAKSIFPKIVVLDAGHGGWDNGTSSADGRYLEKDMNLDMIMYLKELLEQNTDITVYCTRTTDRYLTLNQRIELANSLEADFFISIHCNNAYKNPDANGTEVLYAQQQNDWEGMNSKKLAGLCLEELLAELSLNDRGLVPRGESVTVLLEAEVPAVLNEIGFLSNASDMAVIAKEENRKAAAQAIYRAILRAYEMQETAN